jgi:hypothetical protein
VGQNTTWGTNTPATSIWHGLEPTTQFTPHIKNTLFDEQRGSLAPAFLSSQLEQYGEFDLKGIATYEDLLYLLGMGLGLPAPTGNGAAKTISAVSVAATKTITAISIATPAQITSATHGLSNGDTVIITGSNSTPVVDGTYIVSNVTTNTFTVPVNTSGTGTAGSISTPSIVTTSTAHGLTSGGYAIISGSNSTPVVDGAWVVSVHDTTHYAIAAWCTGAGTAGSSANPATWTFNPAGAASWTPLTLSMELGNIVAGGPVIIGDAAMLQTWEISGTFAQPLKFTGKGFFKHFNGSGSFAAGLNYRTVEPILMPQMSLSLDAAGTTPGTTPYAGTLFSFTLSGTTGLTPVFAAGSKEPIAYIVDKQDLKLKLGLLFTPTLSTFLNTNAVGGKAIIAQLKAVSGSKSFIANFSGALSGDNAWWGDSQKAQAVEIELSAQYDAAMGNYAQLVLANAVATLP